MRFAGVESVAACLQGQTEPQTPQKPPTLVCACRGCSLVAEAEIVEDVM
jgi:hypothetical protein